MVQVLPAVPKKEKKSFLEQVGPLLQTGMQFAGKIHEEKKQMRQQKQENETAKKLGINLEGIRDPDTRRQLIVEGLKGGIKKQEYADQLMRNEKILRDLEKKRGLQEGELQPYIEDVKMAESVSKPAKEGKMPLTEKPVPTEISRKIKKVLVDNPKASADELRSIMDEEGVPPVYSNPYTENRRREQEQFAKSEESKKSSLRQETLPLRTEIAKKALASEKGIQNKEELLHLIEKGNINDPTYAALAEALPLNLGKRLLSDDTVTYKAGLVDEFTDLRNIFQGQTRIKEIDLLEDKLADLYLTDSQKRAVLNSRINALRADMIRGEVAAELEDSGLGVLQFGIEVEKKSKPRLEALFNQILDEQKAIIQNAENRKKIPLNINDSDDKKIIEQIYLEANRDWKKAEQIAKDKGYNW